MFKQQFARYVAKLTGNTIMSGKSERLAGKDLRVRRTRLALHDAFMALIEEKGFDAIIVQDIADRAMINRVTFYKHYRDKYDLLDQTMQAFLNEFADSLKILVLEPAGKVVFDGLVQWFEQVARHASFYRMMLGRNGNAAFAAQLSDYLERMIEQALQQVFVEPPLGETQYVLMRRFAAAGFLGVTEWWLEQEQPISIPEMAVHLQQLLWKLTPPAEEFVRMGN
jgi:AcrR family transcriptional regulator